MLTVALLTNLSLSVHANTNTEDSTPDATTMMMQAATALAKQKSGPLAATGLGWVFGALGESSDPDKKLVKELKSIETTLQGIETELNTVESSIVNVYKKLLDNQAKSILKTLNTEVGKIEPHWATYKTYIKNQSAKSSDLKKSAADIISDVSTALDQIDNNLTSNGSGSTGLIEAYSKVISDKYTTNTLGDTGYYNDLHGTIAYYNKWRLIAVILLSEAYHYTALENAGKGVTIKTVCQSNNLTEITSSNCSLASHYAYRYYKPSSANPNAGVIKQLQIAGASVEDSNTMPMVVPVSNQGVPGVKAYLWSLNSDIPFQFPPLPLPTGTTTNYQWSNPGGHSRFANMVAESAYIPGTINYHGFTAWNFARDKDIQNLITALAPRSGTTVSATLSTKFPNITGRGTYTMATSELNTPGVYDYRLKQPATYGTVGIKWVKYLSMSNDASNPFVYGSLVPGGWGECSETPPPGILEDFLYYQNNTISCPDPAFCNCQTGATPSTIYWGLSTENSNDTSLYGQAWAIANGNSCPVGQKGVNYAGWLKPCGNDWVQQRYSSYLPPQS